MKIDGHAKITGAAVNEFLAEADPAVSAFAGTQLVYETQSDHGPTSIKTLGYYAVKRDLIDVVTTGHWSNFAQRHHFMRRFDGQSPFEAYEDACNWVVSNAIDFADGAVRAMGSFKLQALGNACHAIEDSFAGGHAVRERHGGPLLPGAITHIKMYAGAEKEDHDHMDTTWWDAGRDDFSLEGKLAKNAVKALLAVVFADVARARSGRQRSLSGLSGWVGFRNRWLKASSKLSKERDAAHDLVDDFYAGIVWGDTNHAFNFDEAGLADAIHDRLGDDTRKVYQAFQRIYEYHTVDSDDVAEIYVDKLRNAPSSRVARAVLADRRLADFLIKLLDEGWTSDGEQACIDFLARKSP